MQNLLRLPILHFIIIGGLLFFIYEKLKPEGKEIVSITSQTIDALIQQQAELQQYQVTDEQREELIRGHIEDEVLLRVAYSRGLDKNDFRVRKRILSLVRSSLTEVIPEPTYSQLQAYFDENIDQYTTDSAWSFQQVYFNFNSKKLPPDPGAFKKSLFSSYSEELGDFSGYGTPRSKISFDQMAGTYGKKFAEDVINAPVDSWIGPINSNLGTHYLKVTEIHNPEIPTFDQIESYLKQDYVFRKTRALQEDKIRALSDQFIIVVEGEEVAL